MIFIKIFFLLMLVFPTSFQVQRGIFLVSILMISVIRNTKIKIDNDIFLFWSIIMCFSIHHFVRGYILGAPGAISMTPVFIFWPILYFYFIGATKQLRQINQYNQVILWGSIGSSLSIILFMVNSIIPLSEVVSYIAEEQRFNANFTLGGFIEIFTNNLTNMPYFLGFSMTVIFLHIGKIKNRDIKLAIFSIILSAGVILISSRRAFWLIALLYPFIIFILFRLSGIKTRIKSFVIISLIFMIIVIVLFAFIVDINIIMRDFKSSFNFDTDKSNLTRVEQFIALIDGWKERPLFGHGLGSFTPNSIRDKIQVWSYELTYIALLFQTGIIGLIIYACSVYCIFYKSLKIIKKNKEFAGIILPQLVGLAGLLIVSATNPYLLKFDFLWALFLPVASINSYICGIN